MEPQKSDWTARTVRRRKTETRYQKYLLPDIQAGQFPDCQPDGHRPGTEPVIHCLLFFVFVRMNGFVLSAHSEIS